MTHVTQSEVTHMMGCSLASASLRTSQTLLGWFLLFAGFTLVAVGLGYGMVEEQLFDAWPLTLLAIAIGICVGLVLHRPRGED
jgi:hypothetical protein